tara:strand:+ start:19 stop:750 length:732 start_codon:yes stop_codon:yes gene_type:complete
MISIFLEKFKNEINGIAHVGAHLGQEVEQYLKFNVKKIYLFEPQNAIFNNLLKKMNNYENVKCFNIGLGSKNQSNTLYKSDGNEGKSSSILEPNYHLKVQPDIQFNETEEITVQRFDDLGIETLNFLTIDVQGYELEVIKGFGDKLNDVEFIFTEINTKNLYSDNALVKDIDEYLKQYNFIRIFTNIDCFKHYGDAFYIKQSNKNYKKPFLDFLIKNIVISNFYLNFKKIFYPKKLIKLIFNI